MRGPSSPSANKDIEKPGGSLIAFPGTSTKGISFSAIGIAVGAGGSGSRLGPPMLNVQAPSNNRGTRSVLFIILDITRFSGWLETKLYFALNIVISVL